jgi:Rrf2 family protein
MTSRFAIAIHLVGMLAWSREQGGAGFNSDIIARSVNTHPVVVRRVLASLQQAGLIKTKRGPGGGAQLVRCPATITLRDIYEAIQDEQTLLHLPASTPNKDCQVGATISSYLQNLFGDIEQALLKRLGNITLAQMHADIAPNIRVSCPTLDSVLQMLDKHEGDETSAAPKENL